MPPPRPLHLTLLLGLAACAAGPRPPVVALDPGAQRCEAWTPPAAPLELVVLGSGGPRSFGRASSAYAVLVDGVPRVLVDAGPGAAVRWGALRLDFEQLDTYLLTHLHIDHAGDLPGMVKSRDLSFSQPLQFRLFGPTGGGDYPSTTAFVAALFGEAGAFRYLKDFRNELRLEVTDVPAGRGGPPRVLLEEPDLRVLAVAVDHDDVPALAFRIESHGRAVVVSGDLGSSDGALVALARDAEGLVYDATVLDPPAASPLLYRLHTAPARIGEVAAQAGVKALVLSHLTPSVEAAPEAVLASIAGRYRGPVRFAEDCLRVPAGP
jgi:ribonuclease BN (tRNA processing enzyme)